MFESVLGRGAQPPRLLGRGALLSAAVHVGLLGVVLGLAVPKVVPKAAPDLPRLFLAPPPKPPPATILTTPAPAEKVSRPAKKNTIVDSSEPVPETNPDPNPNPAAVEGPVTARNTGDGVGSAGASACGQAGQPPCGPACGLAGQPPCAPPCGGAGNPCAPSNVETVLSMNDQMVRPSLVSGEERPQPPREALLARVEGLIVAKCIVTADGDVTHCKMIKTLPHMDEAVLSNLESRKYKPAIYQGRAVSVWYTFTFRIVPE